MIGVSCTNFCNVPIDNWAEPISKDFKHWEIFSEAEHSIIGQESHINDVLGKTGLSCSVHAPICDLNLGAMSERLLKASLKEIIGTISSAVDIGAETVTVHPGLCSMAVHGTEEKAQERTISTLRTIDRFATDCGACVVIENMPNVPFFLGRTAESLAKLVDGTDLGICFDIGHANTMGQIDAMIDLFADRISNIHIHDNNGERDEHLTIGDGSIDFEHVIRRLSGYKGNYIIESKDFPSAVLSNQRLKKLLE